jgi:hypothetical protein
MSNTDILLAMAGKRTKARKAAILAPLREIVKKVNEPSLLGVSFASAKAASEAAAAGLSWQNFAGLACSSCSGYTVADVRRILKART